MKSVANIKSNILTLVSGTALGQIITFALMPVVTRIYSPSDIGILNLFNTLAMLLAVIMPMSLHHAIQLSDNRNILNIVLSIITSCIVWVIIVEIVIFISIYYFNYNIFGLGYYVYFIPILSLLMSLTYTFEQVMYKNKMYKKQSTTFIFQSATNQLSKILFGWLGFINSITLISTTLFSYIVRVIFQLHESKDLFKIKNNLDISSIIGNYNKYKDFVLFRTPQSVLSAAAIYFPILLINIFYTSDDLGYYSLANSVLGIPLVLLGNTITNVVYSTLSNEKDTHSNNIIKIKKITLSIFKILLVPYVLFASISPEVFSFVFGHTWLESGYYARYLSILSFSIIISRPIISIVPIYRLQKFLLKFDIGSTIFRIMTCYILANYLNVHELVLVYSLITFLHYIALSFFVYLKIKKSEILVHE